MPYATSVLELCGRTPVVRLQRLAKYRNVYLKLESWNPGRSIKDRPILEMIAEAEASGRLRPGMTIVESTSGNTGIALALYGRRKGYRVLCIVDENIPVEKLAMLRAYGAETEVLRGSEETRHADLTEVRIERVRQLLWEHSDYLNLNQYCNPANPLAHERNTAEEILQQAPPGLQAVLLSVGTGGTVTGVSRKIKEKRPDLLVYGVEPQGSTLFGGVKEPYLQQGPGNYFIPEVMDFSCIDDHRKVGDADAFRTTRALARQEGLLLGGSSGAVAFAALKLAEELGANASVLAVCPDTGTKYLDTIYSDSWLLQHGLLEREVKRKELCR